MRSPQTQGEEGDQGTLMHHRTLLVGPNLKGGLAFGATPEAFGPRNCGQLAGDAAKSHTPAWNENQSIATRSKVASRCCIVVRIAQKCGAIAIAVNKNGTLVNPFRLQIGL